MVWSLDWAWGLPFLVLTVVAHVCALMLIGAAILSAAPARKDKFTRFSFVVAVAVTALCAATLHALEAGVWASLYIYCGALTNWQSAMLYSLEAITSYGHTNVTLGDRWQLLGAIEAVNGLILFGLTTAFLFATINEVRPGLGPRSI